MAAKQQFCLRWNNHQSTLISVFDNLLESGTLVDCTLAAEGQFLKAHKVVLSACSPYLEALLSQHYEKHPILILKDVSFNELKSLLDYMYRGEVNISQDQLGFFLKVAESLQVKGLTDSGALNGSKEIDCSRNSREFARVDRLSGGVLKRNDNRKHSTIGTFAPLAELPPNQLLSTSIHEKDGLSSSQEINAGHTDLSYHNKEDILSPATKRKRVSLRVFNDEQSSASNENLDLDSYENPTSQKKILPALDKVVTPNTQPSIQVLPENDSENPMSNEVAVGQHSVENNFETKVKSEHESVDISDIVKNEDSVEIEEDLEEEGEDEDLSRPGPSSESNSHVAGIPWHIAGEGNGEDLLLANQQDSQGNSTPQQRTRDKINTLCKECGSVIMCNGAVLHLNYCKGVKESEVILKKVHDQDKSLKTNLEISKSGFRIVKKAKKLKNGRKEKEVKKISTNSFADRNQMQEKDSEKQLSPFHSGMKRNVSKNEHFDINTHTGKCTCSECLNLTKIINEDEYHPYSKKGPATCDCGKKYQSNRGLVQHLRYCRKVNHKPSRCINSDSTPDNLNKSKAGSGIKKSKIKETMEFNTSNSTDDICTESHSTADIISTENTRSEEWKEKSDVDKVNSLQPSVNVLHTGSNVSNFSLDDVNSKNAESRIKLTTTSDVKEVHKGTSTMAYIPSPDANSSLHVNVTTVNTLSMVDLTTKIDGEESSLHLHNKINSNSATNDLNNSLSTLQSVKRSSVENSSRSRQKMKSFKCICKCGVMCRSKYAYLLHRRILCNKIKKTKSLLRCNWCSFLSGNSNDLKTHLSMKHMDEISKILSTDQS